MNVKGIHMNRNIRVTLLLSQVMVSLTFACAQATTVDTPVFSPVAGTYTSPQSVVILDAVSGANIYYTTDGTTPTTSSTPYTEAIPVSSKETLSAIATAPGYTASAVGASAYSIVPNEIVPLIQVNGAAWQQTNTATVAVGSTVAIGPQPTNGNTGGTWSWTGPNGFSSTSSAINAMQWSNMGANTYVATYTDPNSIVSTETFTITVTPGGGPITPWVAVNGVWNTTPESRVTVASGTSVNLGPWPVNGAWSWTGPNGFTSTSREIDNIPLSAGDNAFVATYTSPSGVTSTEAFIVTVTVSGGTSTAITPWLQVNGGTWQQANAVAVAPGSTVNLGPWPLTGTWSWVGPNGFTSSSREVDAIPLSTSPGTYTFVATCTVSSVATSQLFTITVTGSNEITPLLQVNGGDWQQINAANVAPGTAISLGPLAVSGGTWSWTGPNGFTASTSEIDNIPLSTGANVFVATYTDLNGVTSMQPFVITVPGTNAITPYIAVNGVWNATPENTVSVSAGAAVNLGPRPTTGGSWRWTGPNGFSSNAREIDAIPLSPGVNSFVATYISGGSAGTDPTASMEAFVITEAAGSGPITPYIALNGVWNTTPASTQTVTAGTAVSLGPKPASGGTWSWTGPNGFTSTSREIDNIPLVVGANAFVASYTLNGVTNTETFVITLTAGSGPITPYIALNGKWDSTPESAKTVPPAPR
jgi:hypothetical protein